MTAHDEQDIRERAYALWEKEGSPHGRDAEFWERAKLLAAAPAAAMGEMFPASEPPTSTADRGRVARKPRAPRRAK